MEVAKNVPSADNSLINKTNNNNSNDIVKTRSQFGTIVLSLENSILPSEKLETTPSVQDGLDAEYEIDLRILGCELIQMSGILLRLPQVAMATGQVLFQRYYYSKSFVRYQMEVTAMACVTLASKIEEAPRRIRDVVNVFHHMKQVRLGIEPTALLLDENYINLKNQVIKAERRLLKELGFCVHVKHPHKMIVTLLQVLENEKNHRLMQTSWNYMNDSLRTNVFVRYSPETIACACIYLSARLLQIPLPNSPPWYEIFGVSEAQIRDVCDSVLKLYTRKKPDQEQLEKIVENLRKEHENAKLKIKEQVSSTTSAIENKIASIIENSQSSRTNSPFNNKSAPSSPNKNTKKNNELNHENSSPKQKCPTPIEVNKIRRSRSGSPYKNDHNKYSFKKDDLETNNRNNKYRDDYSRSRSRSRERDHRHRHHHYHHSKHKRTYRSKSRSGSRSPSSYSYHRHSNNHYLNESDSKYRRRSKSPYDKAYRQKTRYQSPSKDYVRNRSPRR